LLRNFFYRFIIRETDYLMAKGYLKATFKKTIDENLTPLLQRIGVPTLIIWGSEDVVLPLGDGKLMAREIKGSNIEIMRGVGHNPHREAPEKLSGLITEFFKSHDRVQAN